MFPINNTGKKGYLEAYRFCFVLFEKRILKLENKVVTVLSTKIKGCDQGEGMLM